MCPVYYGALKVGTASCRRVNGAGSLKDGEQEEMQRAERSGASEAKRESRKRGPGVLGVVKYGEKRMMVGIDGPTDGGKQPAENGEDDTKSPRPRQFEPAGLSRTRYRVVTRFVTYAPRDGRATARVAGREQARRRHGPSRRRVKLSLSAPMKMPLDSTDPRSSRWTLVSTSDPPFIIKDTPATSAFKLTPSWSVTVTELPLPTGSLRRMLSQMESSSTPGLDKRKRQTTSLQGQESLLPIMRLQPLAPNSNLVY